MKVRSHHYCSSGGTCGQRRDVFCCTWATSAGGLAAQRLSRTAALTEWHSYTRATVAVSRSRCQQLRCRGKAREKLYCTVLPIIQDCTSQLGTPQKWTVKYRPIPYKRVPPAQASLYKVEKLAATPRSLIHVIFLIHPFVADLGMVFSVCTNPHSGRVMHSGLISWVRVLILKVLPWTPLGGNRKWEQCTCRQGARSVQYILRP
jgi:hypothetical protein